MNPNQQGPQGAAGANPYMALLSQLKGGGAGGAQGGGNPNSALEQALSQAGGQGGAESPNQNQAQPGALPSGGGNPGAGASAGADIPDATVEGQNPGTSKMLMSALQQLHAFITAASDPNEIAIVRSIIILLNQLIQRDQVNQGQKTTQMQAAAQAPQPGQGAPGGPPQGAPAGGPPPGQ